MNNVFLLAKVIDISDISFVYMNRLHVYLSVIVSVKSLNNLNNEEIPCILLDEKVDKYYRYLKNMSSSKCENNVQSKLVYIEGKASNFLNIQVVEIYFLKYL